MDWYQMKLALAAATAISQDALHILIGTFGQILLALLLRRRLSDPLPWLIVLLLALANEWSDLRLELWPDRAVQWGESIKDMAVTMAIPTLLLLLVRFWPRLFGERRGGTAGTDEPPSEPLERETGTGMGE